MIAGKFEHTDNSVWEVTWPAGTRYDAKKGKVVVRYSSITVIGTTKLRKACAEVANVLHQRAGYTPEEAQEAISCKHKGLLQ